MGSIESPSIKLNRKTKTQDDHVIFTLRPPGWTNHHRRGQAATVVTGWTVDGDVEQHVMSVQGPGHGHGHGPGRDQALDHGRDHVRSIRDNSDNLNDENDPSAHLQHQHRTRVIHVANVNVVAGMNAMTMRKTPVIARDDTTTAAHIEIEIEIAIEIDHLHHRRENGKNTMIIKNMVASQRQRWWIGSIWSLCRRQGVAQHAIKDIQHGQGHPLLLLRRCQIQQQLVMPDEVANDRNRARNLVHVQDVGDWNRKRTLGERGRRLAPEGGE